MNDIWNHCCITHNATGAALDRCPGCGTLRFFGGASPYGLIGEWGVPPESLKLVAGLVAGGKSESASFPVSVAFRLAIRTEGQVPVHIERCECHIEDRVIPVRGLTGRAVGASTAPNSSFDLRISNPGTYTANVVTWIRVEGQMLAVFAEYTNAVTVSHAGHVTFNINVTGGEKFSSQQVNVQMTRNEVDGELRERRFIPAIDLMANGQRGAVNHSTRLEVPDFCFGKKRWPSSANPPAWFSLPGDPEMPAKDKYGRVIPRPVPLIDPVEGIILGKNRPRWQGGEAHPGGRVDDRGIDHGLWTHAMLRPNMDRDADPNGFRRMLGLIYRRHWQLKPENGQFRLTQLSQPRETRSNLGTRVLQRKGSGLYRPHDLSLGGSDGVGGSVLLNERDILMPWHCDVLPECRFGLRLRYSDPVGGVVRLARLEFVPAGELTRILAEAKIESPSL